MKWLANLAHTTLQYGGGTESLNRMLHRLVECDYFRITIRFVKQESGAAWTVSHNAWANNEDLEVQVNLATEAINVEELDILTDQPDFRAEIVGHCRSAWRQDLCAFPDSI